ncbi:hypothetical protein Hanom_Chr02g00117971 [Helianthus anomalus]
MNHSSLCSHLQMYGLIRTNTYVKSFVGMFFHISKINWFIIYTGLLKIFQSCIRFASKVLLPC